MISYGWTLNTVCRPSKTMVLFCGSHVPSPLIWSTHASQRATASIRKMFASVRSSINVCNLIAAHSTREFVTFAWVSYSLMQSIEGLTIVHVCPSYNYQRPVLFEGVKNISQAKRDVLNAAFGFLETFLNGNKYVAGDNVTIADLSIYASIATIVVRWMCYRIMLRTCNWRQWLSFQQAAGADLTKYPNIQRWYASCASLPGAEENAAGAKIFGDRVISLLEEKLWASAMKMPLFSCSMNMNKWIYIFDSIFLDKIGNLFSSKNFLLFYTVNALEFHPMTSSAHSLPGVRRYRPPYAQHWTRLPISILADTRRATRSYWRHVHRDRLNCSNSIWSLQWSRCTSRRVTWRAIDFCQVARRPAHRECCDTNRADVPCIWSLQIGNHHLHPFEPHTEWWAALWLSPAKSDWDEGCGRISLAEIHSYRLFGGHHLYPAPHRFQPQSVLCCFEQNRLWCWIDSPSSATPFDCLLGARKKKKTHTDNMLGIVLRCAIVSYLLERRVVLVLDCMPDI